MAIQNLPPFYDMPYTDKDGKLTRDSYLYMDQTFQALNAAIILLNDITTTVISKGSVTLNGLNPPSLTGPQIDAVVADTNNPVPLGTIWYDSDMKKLRFLADAGTIETITSA